MKDSADCFSLSLSSLRVFFYCFCLLGDRVGTGRGNQEVLSEQRQNRGNLHPAPNYNTSCQWRLAYTEAILISSGSCGEGLMSLMGGLCTEQLFHTLQSGVVFLVVKRKGKERRRKTDSGKIVRHKRTAFQVCLITSAMISWLISIILWELIATSFLSPAAPTQRRVIPNTQNRQSVLCKACTTAITSVLCHNTKQQRLQKNDTYIKHLITNKSISRLC